jgi:hypothetical protein
MSMSISILLFRSLLNISYILTHFAVSSSCLLLLSFYFLFRLFYLSLHPQDIGVFIYRSCVGLALIRNISLLPAIYQYTDPVANRLFHLKPRGTINISIIHIESQSQSLSLPFFDYFHPIFDSFSDKYFHQIYHHIF